MRTFTKTIIILGLLILSAFSAMANQTWDVKWTFNDVYFDNGNTVTGWFLVNPSLNAYDAYSITVTGPASSQAFTASVVVDAYLPSTIGFANSDFSDYVALYLTSPVTNAGGVIPFGPGLYGNGFDCGGGGGCGTLLIGNGYTPEIIGVTPEPSALLLVFSGLGPAGFWLRRKLI
jgi:hypothetical protein